MGPSNSGSSSQSAAGETFFRLLTLLALGFAITQIWNSSQEFPTADQEISSTPLIPGEKSDTSLTQLTDEIRRDLFTLRSRLDLLEEDSKKGSTPMTVPGSSQQMNDEIALSPEKDEPLPPLTRAQAQTMLKRVNDQIKALDLSLGWSDLLLRRLLEENPLGMSRAVYQALNERFSSYFEVTQGIRQEIYEVWKADPAAVVDDPRSIMALIEDFNAEWEYLDEELQEFLSPEEYTGFSKLVSMAQREQTVMSYLDIQENADEEE